MNKSVNMVKGVAIILMVLAHTRFSQHGDNFINLFHMPLFFFFSGYCFKDAYLTDFKLFALKRIKGIYLPFVVWSILFLLLHNLFCRIHIYDELMFLSSYTDFIKKAMTIIFTMNETEQLLGGYWFLHAYFVASFVFYLSVYLATYLSRLRFKVYIGILCSSCVCVCVCWLMLYFRVRIPFYVNARELLAAFFMLIGYLYKKMNWQWERYLLAVLPVSLGLLIVGMCWGKCGMLTLTYGKLFYYIPAALAGSMLVYAVCQSIVFVPGVSDVLAFIGSKTLGILTWHFISFKLVSLLIVAIYHLPISQVASFPVITEYAVDGWWVLYLIVGVIMPIVIVRGLDNVKRSMIRK